jgi:hypothetical protein
VLTPDAAALDQAIEAARFHTLLAGERRYAATRPLLTALDAAGIPVIVLKGAALAETLYADPGLRPFSDIDLLIRPADVDRARQVLAACGYRPERPLWADDEAAHDCQLTYALPRALGDGEPLVVELHWNLVNNDRLLRATRIDTKPLWAASETATVAGQPVRVLGATHTLLHLCIHLAGHSLQAPMSVRDIAALLDSRQGARVDWQRLARDARRFGVAAMTYAGLQLAARARGARVPAPVLRALRPRGPRRVLLDRWAAALARGKPVPEALSGVLLPLLLDTPGAAGRALAATLFPPPRWLSDRYPAAGKAARWRLYLRHHRALLRLVFTCAVRRDHCP